jgi:hypothetical protein
MRLETLIGVVLSLILEFDREYLSTRISKTRWQTPCRQPK